jgi:hypothetical protein
MVYIGISTRRSTLHYIIWPFMIHNPSDNSYIWPKNLILSEDEVAYELYGGAMGDLLQQKLLPRTYIDA